MLGQLVHVGWKIIGYTVEHATHIHSESSVVASVHNVVDGCTLDLQCTLHLTCCTACPRRLEDNRVYCCSRNLVYTDNVPLLPVYTTLSTAVLSASYVLSNKHVRTACTRRLEDNRIYFCIRNLVYT